MFTNREPPMLLGHNEGANPAEFLLHALAGCVTTIAVLHAAAHGIRIASMSTQLEGGIDLQSLLALDPQVATGYKEYRIMMDIKADCSYEDLDDLLKFAQQYSPVCNTVCRPVPVTIELKGAWR
ncbi:MAG: OsmC family protein [Burkholderiales bacterium]|nr:OsmC family protein [Burkholderiales bacterium]